MKLTKLILLFLAGAFTFNNAASQNVVLNILTQKSGIINIGESGFLEVTVCNTSSVDSVPVYKLRPQISVPSPLVYIPAEGHVLPSDWTITYNSGSVIRLSNATDKIPAHGCRTLLIAIKGKMSGGPSTVTGNLLFSNGVAPGTVSGGATHGDNPADNSSTSSCTIVK